MKFTAQNLFGTNHSENIVLADVGISSNYDLITKTEAIVVLLSGDTSVAEYATKSMITLQVGNAVTKWVAKKMLKKHPRTLKAFNVVSNVSTALSMLKTIQVANEALNILDKTEKKALQAE